MPIRKSQTSEKTRQWGSSLRSHIEKRTFGELIIIAKGAVLNASGRKEEAISAFKEVLRVNRSHAPAYRRLAAIYSSLGRTNEASDVIFNGAAMVPHSALLQFDYAEDLRKNGKPHAAIEPMRRAYDLQPENLRFIVGLAEIEHTEGNETEALRLTSIIKLRLRSGEKLNKEFKSRSDALVARLDPTSSQVRN